ncbi:MAG: shikimate kinase [Bacteroidota bacterium]
MNSTQKNKNKNIYLIGFMGSGKSYLGRQLAQLLSWEFLDLDDFLEANEGMKINRIFAEGGEQLFRDLEKNYLYATIDFTQTVIATGGGAPCFFDNLEWMNRHGQTVYLQASTDLLVKRLINETTHRPLLAGKTLEELQQFIDQKLLYRQSFYQKAAHIFTYQTGRETGEDLLRFLEKGNKRIRG